MSSLSTEALAVAALIAFATAAIGWVYEVQYGSHAGRRGLLVTTHFVAVSVIILSYWWIAWRGYRPGSAPRLALVSGWLIFGCGSAVFWWAAAVHKTSLVPSINHGLTAVGPYRWVRHPIYSGGILGALGLVMVSPTPGLALDLVVLVLAMALLARREEVEASRRLAGYVDYAARTGAFIPKFPGYNRLPSTRFDAVVAISRLEFLFAGVFFLFIVSGLGAGSWMVMRANEWWIALGCGLWVLCHLFGSHVNCLADSELDRSHKPRLSRSVELLGRPFVWTLVALESGGAAAIAAAFSFRHGNVLPFGLFVVGWLIALGYSVEPVRLKARGLLAPLSLLAVLYGLPVAFGYLALARTIEPAVVTLLAAIGAQMLAAILMNAVEDAPDDARHGVHTPVVLYGVRSVTAAAVVAYLIGTAGALYSGALLLPVAAVVPVTLTVTAGHGWVIAMLLRTLWRGDDLVKSEALRRRVGAENPRQFAVVGAAAAVTTFTLLTFGAAGGG